MADHDRTRRWQRPERAGTVSDAIELLRRSILAIRGAPGDGEARRRIRAIAADQGVWEPLAMLLADEVRAHADRPELAAVFYEELADVHETLDQPVEAIAAMEALIALAPEVVAHHERIAALYRQAGAWAKAADALEQVGLRAPDRRADAALVAAAQLNREHGRLDRAGALYRRVVERRPTDLDAVHALDDVLSELGRWDEVAEVRGERAARAPSGVEKAALLRSQARALELAGDLRAAARAMATASDHAPDHVSGLVDQADVLARSGRGREAADILRARIADALQRRASTDDVAALRLRLAQVLEDGCDDPAGALAVLGELLAEAPAHLPALERVTALAASDPDPRAHAIALLRYAAAVPPADRASYVAAAGRRLRDAGDLAGAVEALEHAAGLAADDVELQRELADARIAEQVATAAAAGQGGDVAGARQRLRTIVDAEPHHVDANLALADLLATSGHVDAAAEHLRDTLAEMPEDAPRPATARLVLRLAQLMVALGDADESHQLLHEAHHLDRGSLEVTLALGDSCFARKLWRQAALHLGATGDHPDARRHAAAVVPALLRAAQAEARALRPAHVGRHYEAAVRLDPACAPAWHGLAELARERGDLPRAAECLEHEANATADPAARRRLLDALGDLALDVLADPALAERCWIRIADADHRPTLAKLLALQRRRGATVERADTCARLARLEPDAGARKALLIEATRALEAGAAIARASAMAEELVDQFPRDPDAIVCAATAALAAGDPRKATAWTRRLIHAGDPEDLRAGLELARAIGAPVTDDDRRFLDANPARVMAADEVYAGALDDADRRELVDDPAEPPLREVLALLAEALPLVGPSASAALIDAGLPDAQRVPASSVVPAAALYPQIARALGGPAVLLYTTPHPVTELELLFAAPPVVVMGPGLAAAQGDADVAGDAALRFRLGRIVELSRPHRVFAAMPEDAFVQLVAGLRLGFGPRPDAAAPPAILAEAERLRSRLSVGLRQRLTERLAAIPTDELEPRAYLAACQRAADRAGLLACGDVTVAVRLAGGPRDALHLVHLTASRRYLAARRKLRAR